MTWKPGPDHPWNVRVRAATEKAAARKAQRDRGMVALFDHLREEEEAFELEEETNIQRAIRDYLGT